MHCARIASLRIYAMLKCDLAEKLAESPVVTNQRPQARFTLGLHCGHLPSIKCRAGDEVD